ncbi:sugar transferase [Pelagibacterium halotolerans]|uniref:sugar transferase n=1 Tax=Pelagibacterium halotolerans TaxID=531813 RepID=UPI00385095EF
MSGDATAVRRSSLPAVPLTSIHKTSGATSETALRKHARLAQLSESGLPIIYIGDQPMEPALTGMRIVQFAIKRLLDICLAGLALCVLGPFLLGITIAIRATSKGPAVFRQVREGRNGRHFTIYKFRTMYIDACDRSGVAQTVTSDPRVTPLGAVLRRKNIDELPQLLNVLRGDMSLIGPRPHPVGMLAAGKLYRDLVPYYDLRLAMKPGLSGWAQVSGLRGATVNEAPARARIDHDVAYIQNFSVLLDLKIIARTIFQEMRRGTGD